MSVKIVLSENRLETINNNSKRPIENEYIGNLFNQLVWASTTLEYKQISKQLRDILLDDSNGEFECQHPEWFDESIEEVAKVDTTVCDFCGYREPCEKSLENLTIEIQGLSFIKNHGYMIQPQDYVGALQSCFKAKNRADETVMIDPFVGFSPLSNKSRTLYLIPYSSLTKRFPDQRSNFILQSAIGYDLKTAQSIWPVDLRILQLLMDKKFMAKLKEKVRKNLNLQKLSILDLRSLKKINTQREWNNAKTSQEYLSALESIFAKLVSIIKLFKEFETIAITPHKPYIDHPFASTGSGWVVIAVRILELDPQFFDYLLKYNADDALFLDEMFNDKFERMGGLSIELDTEVRRFIPRFPAILLQPLNQNSEARLELPSCRIIKMHRVSISEPCLLIDSLNFELSELKGWYFA